MYPVSLSTQTTSAGSQWLCCSPVGGQTAYSLREERWPPAQTGVAGEVPGAAGRGLPFRCGRSALACRARSGASWPVAQVLRNPAESCRGPSPNQARRGGPPRARAQPAVLHPAWRVLPPGGAWCRVPEPELLLWASERAPWVLMGRGSREGCAGPYAFPPSCPLFIIINNEILRPGC